MKNLRAGEVRNLAKAMIHYWFETDLSASSAHTLNYNMTSFLCTISPLNYPAKQAGLCPCAHFNMRTLSPSGSRTGSTIPG